MKSKPEGQLKPHDGGLARCGDLPVAWESMAWDVHLGIHQEPIAHREPIFSNVCDLSQGTLGQEALDTLSNFTTFLHATRPSLLGGLSIQECEVPRILLIKKWKLTCGKTHFPSGKTSLFASMLVGKKATLLLFSVLVCLVFIATYPSFLFCLFSASARTAQLRTPGGRGGGDQRVPCAASARPRLANARGTGPVLPHLPAPRILRDAGHLSCRHFVSRKTKHLKPHSSSFQLAYLGDATRFSGASTPGSCRKTGNHPTNHIQGIKMNCCKSNWRAAEFWKFGSLLTHPRCPGDNESEARWRLWRDTLRAGLWLALGFEGGALAALRHRDRRLEREASREPAADV